MARIWDMILSIIWIGSNIMIVVVDFIIAIVFALLAKLFGNNLGINFIEISKVFINVAKFNALPRFATVKESKRNLKKFDSFTVFFYIIVKGIWSYIAHMFIGIINLILCVFIITIPLCYPWAQIHFQLASVEYNPFKYNIKFDMDLEDSDNEKSKKRSSHSGYSSTQSSAYSSAEPSPVPKSHKRKHRTI